MRLSYVSSRTDRPLSRLPTKALIRVTIRKIPDMASIRHNKGTRLRDTLSSMDNSILNSRGMASSRTECSLK